MKLQYLILSFAASCLFAGCGESVDLRTSGLRQELMLTSIPGEATPVGEIRKALKADGAPDSIDAIVRGRIYIGDSSPWETGKAAFVMTDAAGHDGEKDHDPHTCPFCKTHIEDYFMFVSFPGDDCKTIEIDSRELFGVNEKQRVFVTGKATLNEANEVIFEGSRLFAE